jgi:hypothetical protein
MHLLGLWWPKPSAMDSTSNSPTRCNVAGEVMQRLSALLQAKAHPSSSPQDHSSHLAVHRKVAIDKFTKWIEAKPIKKLDGSSTIKFFNEIIVRYGLSGTPTTGQQDKLRRLLQPDGNPARPGLSGTPTVKWAGRESKRTGPSRHQANICRTPRTLSWLLG